MFCRGLQVNLVLDLYVKLDDVLSETIGLHQVNGGVVTSNAMRVTSHMRYGAECCIATRPIKSDGFRFLAYF